MTADKTIGVGDKHVVITVAKDAVIQQASGFAKPMFTVNGGSLTLEGDGVFRGCLAEDGSDSNGCEASHEQAKGGVAQILGGTLTVTGGTFERFNGTAGAVFSAENAAAGSKVVIKNGAFRHNTADTGGVLDLGGKRHDDDFRRHLRLQHGNHERQWRRCHQ